MARRCPLCGNRDLIPIVYGMPGPDLQEEWERGEIALGGCEISDDDPERHCPRCRINLFDDATFTFDRYGMPEGRFRAPAGADPDTSWLRLDVDNLCAEEMAGRAPGTPGGELSARYVEARMEALGLDPAGEDRYRQAIVSIGASNILGALRGTGEGWILVAAHHDHLGEWAGDTYWGANDNAAAVAVMLQVARRLIERPEPPRRSVLFAAFDAEEPPNFMGPAMGSQWFVDHPTIPLDRLDLMVALDLVGARLGPAGLPPEVGESIFVQGAETSTGTLDLVDGLPPVSGIRPRHLTEWVIPPMSDHHAFRNAGIPWVFYTVGRDANYHMPTDTPDTLDYPKMAALTAHLTHLAAAAADHPGHRRCIEEPIGDDAVLDTLDGLLETLAGAFPQAGEAVAIVEELRGHLEAGRLVPEDRLRAQGIVLGLEETLGSR